MGHIMLDMSEIYNILCLTLYINNNEGELEKVVIYTNWSLFNMAMP